MSYLEQIKQEVVDKREEVIEGYKTFVTDFLLDDFAHTEDNTAIVGFSVIINEGITPTLLADWLHTEGFKVKTVNEILQVNYK